MKLNVQEREAVSKNESKRLRREGVIPAILYSQGNPTKNIQISRCEYEALIRSIVPGRLSTTVLVLVNDKGVERKVLIKEIQYHSTTYNIIHIDFEELFSDVPVNVKVPIECIGVANCVGIKLGGVLRQVVRKLKVRCLPKDIPGYFNLDITELKIKGFRRLSDIDMPKTIRPVGNLNEVAVVIVKR